jgi:hypothetical protein
MWVFVVAACLLSAWVGGYISSEKGRDTGEGVALGILLGPLGVLVAALLPVKPQEIARPTRPVRTPDDDPYDARDLYAKRTMRR